MNRDVPDAANVAVSGTTERIPMARRLRCAVRMQQLSGAEVRVDWDPLSPNGVVPLARCRELLGNEAAGLSDEELDRVRQHAAAMAHVLVLAFLEDSSTVG
jgi:hypothetical protein